jgi:hypothetical protein
MSARSQLFLRLAIPAFFGGLLLVLVPSMGMFWQGLALIGLGFLTLALWYWGIGSRKPRGARKAAGPTFSADDPEVAALPPTSLTQISEQLRLARERQKRAQE